MIILNKRERIRPFGVWQGYVAGKQNMETVKKYFRVDHHDIGFIKFIIEAYEGLAVMTTVDRGKGVVELNIAPGCEVEIDLILKDLKKDLLIESIDFCPMGQGVMEENR